MGITEKDRHDLFTVIESTWGTSSAETLMRMLATRDDLVTKDHLHRELAQLREEVATKGWVREQFATHTRMFVTWLLTALAAQTAIIATLVGLS